jgi:hypothetical protein
MLDGNWGELHCASILGSPGTDLPMSRANVGKYDGFQVPVHEIAVEEDQIQR